jgi:hypothetical protein
MGLWLLNAVSTRVMLQFPFPPVCPLPFCFSTLAFLAGANGIWGFYHDPNVGGQFALAGISRHEFGHVMGSSGVSNMPTKHALWYL